MAADDDEEECLQQEEQQYELKLPFLRGRVLLLMPRSHSCTYNSRSEGMIERCVGLVCGLNECDSIIRIRYQVAGCIAIVIPAMHSGGYQCENHAICLSIYL